jgi:hypothetical protein
LCLVFDGLAIGSNDDHPQAHLAEALGALLGLTERILFGCEVPVITRSLQLTAKYLISSVQDPWLASLQDRNLNVVEIGWPFRLGLEGCIVDRSQEIGWQRTFGHGRKIVPEMLQRRGADDDAIIAFGV